MKETNLEIYSQISQLFHCWTNIKLHFLIFAQVLKVWELTDHTCVQTVIVPFPTSLHGHLPEHGAFPLHLQLGPGSHSLLLTANDYLASLKVSSTPMLGVQLDPLWPPRLCQGVHFFFLPPDGERCPWREQTFTNLTRLICFLIKSVLMEIVEPVWCQQHCD